jgi:DNA-binding transcriptional ArsR family regulator
MPIDRRPIGESGALVLDFLKRSSDQAFTIGELDEELRGKGLSVDDIDAALHALYANELIDIQLESNRIYYSYRVPLGFQLE